MKIKIIMERGALIMQVINLKVITVILITAVMFSTLVLGSSPSSADTGSSSTAIDRPGPASMFDNGNEPIPVTIVPESALRYIGDD